MVSSPDNNRDIIMLRIDYIANNKKLVVVTVVLIQNKNENGGKNWQKIRKFKKCLKLPDCVTQRVLLLGFIVLVLTSTFFVSVTFINSCHDTVLFCFLLFTFPILIAFTSFVLWLA